mmetsp:Transcript_29093/g.46664  ORF Transcript_29093/g.46664 Transcript_29093/m.46664 type:complete len:292 (+) Transcript_29093:102-977(+)|eukprot:CAMPEP_0115119906 /NCGR_PEP_ID=MMETSP0227-20121206/45368_1 /TAXON_ID=89957 /ORGANISM="Polarella glacialis, Strain CCMP 1383" /LENGTH=291 /DNA_ID=CAMNT_0002521461 /DNA_START=73 /DNA_END=948 /DNA_ORIENTATION=-
MADAAPSLGDFFAKKTKKKITSKATNLNNTADAAGKPEEVKKKKNAEEDAWQEEELVAATMKVEAAGKLIREEDKKEEEESKAPSWGKTVKNKVIQNDRKYPTLAKSIQSSSIQLEDTSGKVNIQTSQNAFSALEGEGSDDEGGPKRPSKIQPAMVTKKKGEMQKDAIQREVGRYKKDDKKAAAEDEAEDEKDEEAEKEAKAKRKEEKKEKNKVQEVAAEQKELDEDVKIQPNLVAAKAKYSGRKKLPKTDLPKEELDEEKENKPVKSSKKKAANLDEEEDGKKLTYWQGD